MLPSADLIKQETDMEPQPRPAGPYAPEESVVEFTLRAVVAGIVFGIIFGAANAYLGLRVGLTVSTSIPIAVLTVALFRLMQRRPGGVILEANMSQTIGSASSSLASGTIFTIPALFLWGFTPPYWQVAILALPRRHPRHHRHGAAAAAADRQERRRASPIPRARPAPRCCAPTAAELERRALDLHRPRGGRGDQARPRRLRPGPRPSWLSAPRRRCPRPSWPWRSRPPCSRWATSSATGSRRSWSPAA